MFSRLFCFLNDLEKIGMLKGGYTIAKHTTDEQIIAALITHATKREAAAAVGLGMTTLYTRMKKEGFQKKYRAACRELLKNHTAAIQSHMGAAIDATREIMDDENNAPQVRLNAADAILRHGMRMTEQMDILDQLDELEGEED